MAMFTHVTVGTNDLNRARQFYDAVLAPLGYKRVKDLGDRGSCWGATSEEFIVLPGRWRGRHRRKRRHRQLRGAEPCRGRCFP